MHIAYFVTGHGYGHAIRSATIANNFSQSTDVTFVTSIERTFFEREMTRPFKYLKREFDCGCLQSSGVSVDIQETLETYATIAGRNNDELLQMVAWCKKHGITKVASDCTPFAFDIANACGLPSAAVTNFTWYDIYQEYVETYPRFRTMVETIRLQYEKADTLLALTPALPMRYFRNRQEIPLVGRTGVCLSKKLFDAYQLAHGDKRTGIIYVGNFGMPGAAWQMLEEYIDWEFFGIQELPCNVKNYHQIDFSRVPYADMIASVDCVFAKLGYGVVSECMLNRTPLIYLPRTNFAEYPILEDAVEKWGGGVQITESLFAEIKWSSALEKLKRRELLPHLPPGGAKICANYIESGS